MPGAVQGGRDSAPNNSMCKGPEAGQFEQLIEGWVAGSGAGREAPEFKGPHDPWGRAWILS